MNLFVLSVYDSAYHAEMFENGFLINLTVDMNRYAFIERFHVPPEQISIEVLKKLLPPDTEIVLCVDGEIEIGDNSIPKCGEI